MRDQAISLHRNFLILTIVINSSHGGYINTMGDEQECEVIKKFVTGDFNVPVSERTLKKSETKKIVT